MEMMSTIHRELKKHMDESELAVQLAAVEFGFRCAESGWGITRTLEEARKLLKGDK